MKKIYFILAILAGVCLSVQGKTISEGPATAGDPIIIELGSGTIKAGLASQAAPLTFPAVVAKSGATYYVGDEAIAKNKSMGLTLKYPIEQGYVTNWTEFKEILRYAFARLNVNPANHEVLITEAPLNTKANREAITNMLFNDFNVKGMYTAIDAVLALYATNRTTGIVVHSEDGISYAAPIYEGFALSHAILRLDIGNKDLADYMVQKLNSKGHTISREVAYDILKKTDYVANDFDAEMEKSESEIMKSYQLPGGQTINIGRERFNVIEALFKPSFFGMEDDGIHTTAYDCIVKCDVELRKTLYANIVLSGSGTTYSGMAERLKREVIALANRNVIVSAQENREYLVWQGGKKIAPVFSTNKMWVTRAEFSAEGSGIVHRKCF